MPNGQTIWHNFPFLSQVDLTLKMHAISFSRVAFPYLDTRKELLKYDIRVTSFQSLLELQSLRWQGKILVAFCFKDKLCYDSSWVQIP